MRCVVHADAFILAPVALHPLHRVVFAGALSLPFEPQEAVVVRGLLYNRVHHQIKDPSSHLSAAGFKREVYHRNAKTEFRGLVKGSPATTAQFDLERYAAAGKAGIRPQLDDAVDAAHIGYVRCANDCVHLGDGLVVLIVDRVEEPPLNQIPKIQRVGRDVCDHIHGGAPATFPTICVRLITRAVNRAPVQSESGTLPRCLIFSVTRQSHCAAQ